MKMSNTCIVTRQSAIARALAAALALALAATATSPKTAPAQPIAAESTAHSGAAESECAVTDLHPDKARYSPGEQITITVTVHNATAAPVAAKIVLRVLHLADEVRTEERAIAIGANESRVELFSWPAPEPDFRGYLVTASLNGQPPSSTAVDVSSTPVRFPRYGYVSQFGKGAQTETAAGIRELAQKFHINMFQFYDWFWRHEQLIRREKGVIADAWLDLFGTLNSWATVQALVGEAKMYNSAPLSYVMSYAAREGYAEVSPVSPAWGLYARNDGTNQLSINFNFGSGPSLYLFDPGNTGWQDWIISQYIDAIDTAGFDGVHIDQFGPRYDVYDASGAALDLPARFVMFLDAVKARLVENDPDRALCTFNIVDGEVDGWAVGAVAAARNCDFLFSELWFEADTYDDILSYVEYVRRLGGGRPVVLAGYSNYAEDIGPLHEGEDAAQRLGVTLNDDHPGFTGSGFADGFDQVGDSIAWKISGPADLSSVTFVVRYANATGTIATRNVYLDDRLVGQMRFSNREQWSAWATDAWVQTLVEPGEHTLRIAYDEGNVGALNIDHLRLGEFDEDSVRLENAVMFASGASHIQLGDDIQSLSHEYYPNRSKSLTTSLRRALRRYYDFITAYENLLFDPELELLGDAEAELLVLTGQSLQPSPNGRIFTVERRARRYHVLHLINLIGLDNERWRDSAPFPIFQKDVRLRYYVPDAERVNEIYVTSPDLAAAVPTALEFSIGADERGDYLEFVVPTLHYWDVIFMTRAA